tara:strand:- start:1402 stop:1554 length:153 start_codon:yes stop_codon:yes gene_type:complete
MNHYLATYIDFIQSIGFISIFALATFLAIKLFLANKSDNYIEAVKIRIDE